MKLISSLAVGAILAIAPAASGAATDTFTRTVASGWGTADFGGAWTADSGASDFSVNGTTGRIRLAAGGANRAIFLAATSVDWDVSTSVALDKVPAGGSAWLYHELRRSTANTNSYRLLARFATDGTTYLSASRVVNGAEVADRQRRRRPVRQLPHRLHAARPGHRHQPDHHPRQGLDRQRARRLAVHRHRQRRPAGRRPRRPPQLHLGQHHQRAAHGDGRQLRGERHARRRPLRRRPAASSSTAATAAPLRRRRRRRLLLRRRRRLRLRRLLLHRRRRRRRHLRRPAAPPTRSRGRSRVAGAPLTLGGAWAPDSGIGDFSVNGTTGRIRLAAGGANRAIFLSRDRRSTGTSRPASRSTRSRPAGSAWIYHELRRSSTNTNSYRLLARFAATAPRPSAPRASSTARGAIGTAVAVPSVDYRTGFTLRGQLTGTNPTTIRIKAWTGTEPSAWQFTATDSAGPQVAGRAGLRTYTSSSTTNAPLTRDDRQLLRQRDRHAASASASTAATTSAPPPPRLRHPPPPPPPPR